MSRFWVAAIVAVSVGPWTACDGLGMGSVAWDPEVGTQRILTPKKLPVPERAELVENGRLFPRHLAPPPLPPREDLDAPAGWTRVGPQEWAIVPAERAKPRLLRIRSTSGDATELVAKVLAQSRLDDVRHPPIEEIDAAAQVRQRMFYAAGTARAHGRTVGFDVVVLQQADGKAVAELLYASPGVLASWDGPLVTLQRWGLLPEGPLGIQDDTRVELGRAAPTERIRHFEARANAAIVHRVQRDGAKITVPRP